MDACDAVRLADIGSVRPLCVMLLLGGRVEALDAVRLVDIVSRIRLRVLGGRWWIGCNVMPQRTKERGKAESQSRGGHAPSWLCALL